MTSVDSAFASSMATPPVAQAYRGMILHALSEDELVFLSDGGMLVDVSGSIVACDHWQTLESKGHLKGFKTTVLSPQALIIPGFVDMHVHLPQVDVAGCQEHNLLSWLERHIFPAEARFEEADHARLLSDWFFKALLANGTTTAAAFLTSHPEATQIAFETAERIGNRVIMGQNLMDANAPDTLLRDTQAQLRETEALCQQWHGRDQGRLQYAWMPRFAITSTEPLLEGIGRLRQQFPDVYMHTHLSEQPSEIAEVLKQFPWANDYTGVYERFGLLGQRTILAHGVHLSDGELDRLHQCDASLAHCPSSNFFLKSGRFRLMEILRRGLRMGLGSDVGAGPEICLWKVMKDAQYMQADTLVSLKSLFYSATLGGAKALFMDERVGNFLPGKEADFVILDTTAKPSMGPVSALTGQPPAWIGEDASDRCQEALLSRLVYLGDDRLVQSTYVRGQRRWFRRA